MEEKTQSGGVCVAGDCLIKNVQFLSSGKTCKSLLIQAIYDC